VAVRVIASSCELQSAFLAMLDDFERRDPHNTGFYAPARAGFAKYVQSLLDE